MVIVNVWHHRFDAYSFVVALVSIGLAMTVPGFLAADPATEIMGEIVKQLTDAVTDEDLVRNVEISAKDYDEVSEVTKVQARQVGITALVDVSITNVPCLLGHASRGRTIEGAYPLGGTGRPRCQGQGYGRGYGRHLSAFVGRRRG